MKKTINAASKKLSLNVQTVRTLTSQELTLVVGGMCQHGSDPSVIVPGPGVAGGGDGKPPHIPTC